MKMTIISAICALICAAISAVSFALEMHIAYTIIAAFLSLGSLFAAFDYLLDKKEN